MTCPPLPRLRRELPELSESAALSALGMAALALRPDLAVTWDSSADGLG